MTICTYDRIGLFGEVNDKKMILNRWGQIAWDEWQKTASIRDNVALDAFVIMPNHVHGIIQIVGSNNEGTYRDTSLQNNTPLRNMNPEQQPEFRSIQNSRRHHPGI